MSLAPEVYVPLPPHTHTHSPPSTHTQPGIFSMLRDVPAVYQQLYRDMFRLGGLPVCTRLYILLVLLLAVLYLISPIDLIPEALFGVLGLGDDLFAIAMALLYGVNLYREYIVRIGEVQR